MGKIICSKIRHEYNAAKIYCYLQRKYTTEIRSYTNIVYDGRTERSFTTDVHDSIASYTTIVFHRIRSYTIVAHKLGILQKVKISDDRLILIKLSKKTAFLYIETVFFRQHACFVFVSIYRGKN